MDAREAALILENHFLGNAIKRANEMATKGEEAAANELRKELVSRRNQMLVDAFATPKPTAVIHEVQRLAA